MKKRVFAALMLGSIFTVSSVNAEDPVAAIVNGKEIKVSEVNAETKGMDVGKDIPPETQKQIFTDVQKTLIDYTIMSQAAKAAGLENDPDIKKMAEKIIERLLIQAFISQEVKKIVTEAAIKEAYKKLPPQKEIKLSHIMVKDEATAKAVIKALKSGSDFAQLAKSKSIDEQTAKKGGDLGSALEAQLPLPFFEATKDLPPGTYTQTPIKTHGGYHIVKVDSRTDAPFEAVAPMIREGLEKDAVVKLLDTLKKKATIQLFDQQGKPIKNVPPPAQAVPAS